MFRRQAANKEARRIAGMGGGGDEGGGGKMQVRDLQDLGDIVGEEGTGRGRGKGRGRRRKRVDVGEEIGAAGVNGTANKARSGVGDEDGLDDVEVDIDNDLEAADEDEDRHRNKRARSGNE